MHSRLANKLKVMLIKSITFPNESKAFFKKTCFIFNNKKISHGGIFCLILNNYQILTFLHMYMYENY